MYGFVYGFCFAYAPWAASTRHQAVALRHAAGPPRPAMALNRLAGPYSPCGAVRRLQHSYMGLPLRGQLVKAGRPLRPGRQSVTGQHASSGP